MQITIIFVFLRFTAVFTQSKVHLSEGIDREFFFQSQTSNSLSISTLGFLRTNTDSWENSTVLILLAMDGFSRICEWNILESLSNGRSAHEH